MAEHTSIEATGNPQIDAFVEAIIDEVEDRLKMAPNLRVEALDALVARLLDIDHG